MTQFTYDLNPVHHIIVDAIGEPGARTFFIQGSARREVVNLVLEKEEVTNLAINLLQLLEELEQKFPHLDSASGDNQTLHLEHPIEPTFRIGQLILGYDEQEDMIWLIAKALVFSEETGSVLDPDDERVPVARMVATRDQMRAMGEHALEVVSQGRPVCPLCNRPINRTGHFCPRRDGHAVPVVF
ncbi:MAG: DUF3090 domain-containing protein [Caldilineaceae bacterium]